MQKNLSFATIISFFVGLFLGLIIMFGFVLAFGIMSYNLFPNNSNRNSSTVSAELKCLYEGKYYSPGQGFPASDGCNSCSCSPNGQVACTLMACERSFDTNVCWNAAILDRDTQKLSWSSGCGGLKCDKLAVSLCTQSIMPLDGREVEQYNTWKDRGMPSIPGCECY